jgi:hypothetical protein
MTTAPATTELERQSQLGLDASWLHTLPGACSHDASVLKSVASHPTIQGRRSRSSTGTKQALRGSSRRSVLAHTSRRPFLALWFGEDEGAREGVNRGRQKFSRHLTIAALGEPATPLSFDRQHHRPQRSDCRIARPLLEPSACVEAAKTCLHGGTQVASTASIELRA